MDTNGQGSCIPQIKWRPHGLLIIDKPVVTAIIPNSDNINFPTYSNLGALELFKEKKLEVTRQAMKELRYARYSVGHSVIVYLSWEELLIRILAHELRHHWQHLNRNFRRKITPKTRKNIKLEKEKDADRYAIRKVRLWRQMHHPKDAYPDISFYNE